MRRAVALVAAMALVALMNEQPPPGELGWRCTKCLRVFAMNVDASIGRLPSGDPTTYCRDCRPRSDLDD